MCDESVEQLPAPISPLAPPTDFTCCALHRKSFLVSQFELPKLVFQPKFSLWLTEVSSRHSSNATKSISVDFSLRKFLGKGVDDRLLTTGNPSEKRLTHPATLSRFEQRKREVASYRSTCGRQSDPSFNQRIRRDRATHGKEMKAENSLRCALYRAGGGPSGD